MDFQAIEIPEDQWGDMVDGGEIIGGDSTGSVISKDYTELITTNNILVNVNNVLLVIIIGILLCQAFLGRWNK